MDPDSTPDRETEHLPGDGPDVSHETTIHIRRAGAGDASSVGWLVARFSPLLLAQARYRLARGLRRHYEPEDLVADVWAVALPQLAASDRWREQPSRALVRFLSTTLIYRLNNLMRKHLKRDRLLGQDQAEDSGSDPVAQLPAETTGVITRCIQNEHHSEVLRQLDQLDPIDREIVVLRGIEQNANETVANLLDLKPNTVSHRYRRALEKLKQQMQGSVFGELG